MEHSPNLLQKHELPPPHWGRNGTDNSSEQMHCPAAGSGAVTRYGDRMSQLIPQAPGGASRSPGPHRVGDAGGSRSRAAREPPHFIPTAGKPGSCRALVPLRLSRRFQGRPVQQVRPFILFLTRFWSSYP